MGRRLSLGRRLSRGGRGSLDRRTFLRSALATAAVGSGVSTAGCGYRPGGGDLRWREGVMFRLTGFVPCPASGLVLGIEAERMRYAWESNAWFRGGGVTGYGRRGEVVFSHAADAAVRTATLDDSPPEDAAGGDSPARDATLYVGRGDGEVTAVAVPTTTERDGDDEEDAGDPIRWQRPYGDPDVALTGSGDGPDNGGADNDRGDSDGEDARSRTDSDEAPPGVLALAVGDDAVYAGGRAGLTAFDRDGADRWTRTFEAPVGAVVASDRGTYARVGGRLVALDDAGETRWSYEVGVADGSRAAPVVTERTVYATRPGEVVALAHDRSVRWTCDVPRPLGRPAVGGGTCYVTSRGRLTAIGGDGEPRWRWDSNRGIATPPAVAGDTAYVLTGDSLVGVENGTERWRVPLDRPEGFAGRYGPAVLGETIVAASDTELRGYWRSQLREGSDWRPWY